MADDAVAPTNGDPTHKAPEDHMLFDDLVKLSEQRQDVLTRGESVPVVPPPRVVPPPPPPGSDLSRIVFGDAQSEPRITEVPFDMTGGAVFDPTRDIPKGKMVPTPDPEAIEMFFEEAADVVDDGAWVVLKQDVWEEVAVPNSDRPTHILRFSKGQRVPRRSLAGMKVMAQEQSPVRNFETKVKRNARPS